jgi:hypothetical protein
MQIFGTDRWSVSWWANVAGTGDGTQDFFNGLSHRPRIYTNISSANIGIAGRVGGNYTSIISTGSDKYSFGSWNYFVVLADGYNYRIFINGLEEKSVAYVKMDSSFGDFSIGKPNWSNESFKGSIDDVRIYNRTLSESEIKVIYESTR